MTGIKTIKMEINAELKENWKEDKVILNKAISTYFEKSTVTFKEERKSEWPIKLCYE